MTFEEIFNEAGLYRADSFAKDFCFKVDENGSLSTLQYKNAGDLLPTQDHPPVYKGLFKKGLQKSLYNKSAFSGLSFFF